MAYVLGLDVPQKSLKTGSKWAQNGPFSCSILQQFWASVRLHRIHKSRISLGLRCIIRTRHWSKQGGTPPIQNCNNYTRR